MDYSELVHDIQLVFILAVAMSLSRAIAGAAWKRIVNMWEKR